MILSWGLGVDSTAILLRWIQEPASRDFALEDLVVVVAMTGDEWASTGRDCEDHVLPLLRAHGVRLVQAARSRLHTTIAGDGIVILDDSRSPERLHLDGDFRLSDELTLTATVPQVGGDRRCSLRAKGAVLDPVIDALTAGRGYRHAIGFEANELTRAFGNLHTGGKKKGDHVQGPANRSAVYPLIDWNWDRQRCIDFIAGVTGGIVWEKSACSYCPFSLANKEGRQRVLERIAADPAAGVDILMIEHRSLALNPAQGLLGRGSAIDLIRQADLGHVLTAFHDALDASDHVLVEVRRILRPAAKDPAKLGRADRSIRIIATGSRAQLQQRLHQKAARAGFPVSDHDGITRLWLRRRGATLPTREHFVTIAPAGLADKAKPDFDLWWRRLDAGQPLHDTA
ncbi:hypothetical protein [Kineococcus xinjiangensis]|nr:hypothetical protein [Kineococcus xinjiangensis]